MRLVPRCVSAGLCAVTLAFVACNGCNKTEQVDRDGFADRSFDQSDKSGTTNVTGASVGGLTTTVATNRIVLARCEREMACNNIGPDKHYANTDVCTVELHTRVSADLPPRGCPRGIDETALDNCVDAIRGESCNDPAETVERIAVCRTSELCRR